MTNTFDTTACIVWPVRLDPDYDDLRIVDPHVTMVFLGNTEDLPLCSGDLLEVLGEKIPPLESPFVATEEFTVFGFETKFDVVLLDKREDLLYSRQETLRLLGEAGVSDGSSWPDYSPHMTLGLEGCGHWTSHELRLDPPVLWYNNNEYMIV